MPVTCSLTFQRLLALEHVLWLAARPQEMRPALPEQDLRRRGVAQEAEVARGEAVGAAVEDADEVPDLRLGQGDIRAKHVERRAARAGHRDALLLGHPAHAGQV